MVADIIRWLRYEEYYPLRAIALIAGCSYDTVVKTVKGEVHKKVRPSIENMSDEMLERKYVIDKIIELRELYNLQDIEQLGYYATLLRYLGYTKEHLRILFPQMNAGWIHTRYFASDEWKKLDYKLIDITEEEWGKVFGKILQKING